MSLDSCTLDEEWLLQQDRPSWEGTWKLGNKDSDSPALPHLQHFSSALLVFCITEPGCSCPIRRVKTSQDRHRHTHYTQFPSFPWKITSSQAAQEGEDRCIPFQCPAHRALDWGWCGICPEQCLPSCLVPSDMSLDGDGSLPHPHVLLPHQPAPDRLLDADTGSSQLICPYFFQVGYLTSPKKYFCLTKLVLILVLFSKVKRG